MIDQQIDRFLLLSRLGSGSLGDVYKAERLDLLPGAQAAPPKAVKVIDPQLAGRPGFRQELRRLAALSENVARHPQVLPFVLREGDNVIYLEKDLLEEGSLHKYLHRLHGQGGKLEPKTAVALILQLCDVLLNALKEAGFAADDALAAHGGLHPRNVLLRSDPTANEMQLLLTDFGQATLRRRFSTDLPYRGQAPYTPPAVSDGDAPDERADLYAIGHLLYFLRHAAHVDPRSVGETPIFESQWAQPPEAQPFDLGAALDKMALAAMRVYSVQPDPPPPPNDNEDETAVTPAPPPPIENYLAAWYERLQGLAEQAGLPQQPPLSLPPLAAAPTAAETTEPETAAPPHVQDAVAIHINRALPDAPLPGTLPRIHHLRPRQTFLTVGSHPDRDVTLPGDEHVQPHHLDVQWQNNEWQIANHGPAEQTRLGDTPLLTGSVQRWPDGQSLVIGAYALTLQRPSAAPTSDFEVHLLPAIQTVRPGIQAAVGVAIRNRTGRAYFKVEVAGLRPVQGTPDTDVAGSAGDEAWYDLPQDGVILDAGEQRELTITLLPPVDMPGQDYHFKVYVTRWADDQPPGEMTASGTMRVQRSAEFTAALQPEQSRDNGRYLLTIHNHGNQPVTYDIASQDPENQLDFSPDAELIVPRQPARLDSAQTTPPRTSELLRAGRDAGWLLRRLRPLASWQQTAPGRQIGQMESRARRSGRYLNAPATGRPAPSFQPQYRKRKFDEPLKDRLTVPPGHEATYRFLVKRRRRPLLWQPPRVIPFSLTIKPSDAPVAQRQPQTVHASFEATSRLGRAGATLLLGLLLISCLLAALWAAFTGSAHVQQVRAAQSEARRFANADPDGDGLSTLIEITEYGTDPFNKDSDGDGIPDGVEASVLGLGLNPIRKASFLATPDGEKVRYATATPTPLGDQPYPTAEPPPTQTPMPTLTPTVIPPQPVRQETVRALPLSGETAVTFTLGDTTQNTPITRTLTFNTLLPPGAIVESAFFTLVVANIEQFNTARQSLGQLYVTIGDDPLQQTLAGVQPADDDNKIPVEPMTPAANVFIAHVPPTAVNAQGETTLHLYFELVSNLDSASDAVQFYSESPPAGEHPPQLTITYRPATGSGE